MRMFGMWEELTRVLFRKDTKEIQVRPNQTVTYTADRDIQLPNADSDQVIVGRTSTDTLTNKSIDATTNTLTNIANASIAAAAAIARSKIATGSANHVLVNDGSGNFSSEAQLGSTRGGTGINNAGTLTYGSNNISLTTAGATSLTLPTSGTVATLAGSEILQNKTLDNTNSITVKDVNFTVQDDGDVSKQFKLQISGISAATTRTWTVPDSTDTFVGINTAQTLGAKTLSSPEVVTRLRIQDAGTLVLREASGNGTDEISIQAPAALAASYSLTLPVDDGTPSQVLSTDGSGVLSWSTVTTNALNQFNVNVGGATNLAVSVNTNSVGDILADESGGFNIKSGVITSTDFAAGSEASVSQRGTVSTGTQSFAGVKTFQNVANFSGGIITSDIPTAGSITINSGNTLFYPNLTIASGDTYTINGTLIIVGDLTSTGGDLTGTGDIIELN